MNFVVKTIYRRFDEIEPFQFFRISLAVFILLHFLSIWPDFELMYGSNSILPEEIHRVYENFNPITIVKMESVAFEYGVENESFMLGFKCIFIFLCLILLAGIQTRLTAFLLLLMQISLVKSSMLFSYGVDHFTSMSLVYLILLPEFTMKSLCKLFSTEKPNVHIRKLFHIHICIAYFFSGFDKILGINWRNGESIWKVMHLPNFSNDFNLNFEFMHNYPYILIISGWMVILVEMLYPIFFSIKKTRTLWLFLTISMHLGILLILNLYFFSTLMIIWNLTNFLFLQSAEDEKRYAKEHNLAY